MLAKQHKPFALPQVYWTVMGKTINNHPEWIRIPGFV